MERNRQTGGKASEISPLGRPPCPPGCLFDTHWRMTLAATAVSLEPNKVLLQRMTVSLRRTEQLTEWLLSSLRRPSLPDLLWDKAKLIFFDEVQNDFSGVELLQFAPAPRTPPSLLVSRYRHRIFFFYYMGVGYGKNRETTSTTATAAKGERNKDGDQSSCLAN